MGADQRDMVYTKCVYGTERGILTILCKAGMLLACAQEQRQVHEYYSMSSYLALLTAGELWPHDTVHSSPLDGGLPQLGICQHIRAMQK